MEVSGGSAERNPPIHGETPVGCGSLRSTDPPNGNQISSVTPGLASGSSFMEPFISRSVGNVSSLEFSACSQVSGLAGVGRHPAHDRHQGALGHLLQLVDRLGRDDALQQVDVLLDVGVDPSSPDAGLRLAGEPEAAAVQLSPWCR